MHYQAFVVFSFYQNKKNCIINGIYSSLGYEAAIIQNSVILWGLQGQCLSASLYQLFQADLSLIKRCKILTGNAGNLWNNKFVWCQLVKIIGDIRKIQIQASYWLSCSQTDQATDLPMGCKFKFVGYSHLKKIAL